MASNGGGWRPAGRCSVFPSPPPLFLPLSLSAAAFDSFYSDYSEGGLPRPPQGGLTLFTPSFCLATPSLAGAAAALGPPHPRLGRDARQQVLQTRLRHGKQYICHNKYTLAPKQAAAILQICIMRTY